MTKKRGLRGQGNTKRTLHELKNAKPDIVIKIGELALIVEVKESTLKYYCEQGLLPYDQADGGGNRRFKKGEAVQMYYYIQSLKKDRYRIGEIKDLVQKKFRHKGVNT